MPDALEAFLEPYDAIVREFNSRAAINWARAASEVSMLLGIPEALGKANAGPRAQHVCRALHIVEIPLSKRREPRSALLHAVAAHESEGELTFMQDQCILYCASMYHRYDRYRPTSLS